MSTNSISQKLHSIFEHGFLSGAALDQRQQASNAPNIEVSFDPTRRDLVSLNCISAEVGIEVSLLNRAKGGLVVALEEKVNSGGLLDEAVNRNQEKISQEIDKIPRLLASYAQPQAFKKVLAKDVRFQRAISEKLHKTALFVFKDMDMNLGENESSDGCKETGREHISSDKIDRVFISEKLKAIIDNDFEGRVVYIPSKELEEYSFSYLDSHENPQAIDVKESVLAPDYFKALERHIEGIDLSENPIYTHITRL